MPRISDSHVNSEDYWNDTYRTQRYPTLDPNNVRRYTAAAHLQQGLTALDIGCGQAGLGRVLLGQFAELFYVGVDYSADALRSHVIPPVHAGRSMLLRLDDLDKITGLFDTVYLCDIIEHMDAPAILIAAAAQLAARRMVVTVPKYQILTREMHHGEHLWDFTEEELRELLSPYGVVGAVGDANNICWVVAVDIERRQ